MAFGFTVKPDGHISSKKLAVIEQGALRNESKLYHYPFSNVSQNNYETCTGRNRLPDIQELRKIGSLPYYILSLPNNDDYFDVKYNRLGMGNREMLEFLKAAEPLAYYEKVLLEKSCTFKDFICCLKG